MAGQDISVLLWLPPAAEPALCVAVRSHACEPDQFGKPGGCSDICLLGNSHKTRTCRCRSGFSLGSDGKSCKSESWPSLEGWGRGRGAGQTMGSTRAPGRAEPLRSFLPAANSASLPGPGCAPSAGLCSRRSCGLRGQSLPLCRSCHPVKAPVPPAWGCPPAAPPRPGQW